MFLRSGVSGRSKIVTTATQNLEGKKHTPFQSWILSYSSREQSELGWKKTGSDSTD